MKDPKNRTPNPNEQDQARTRDEEEPDRSGLKTAEGLGGRDESKAREDDASTTLRRGER